MFLYVGAHMTYGYVSRYEEWAKAEARVLEAEREYLQQLQSSPSNADLTAEELRVQKLRANAARLLDQLIDTAAEVSDQSDLVRQSLETVVERVVCKHRSWG